MGIVRTYAIGDKVAPLVKSITQEAINRFEGSAGQRGPSQFTDEATARATLRFAFGKSNTRKDIQYVVKCLRDVVSQMTGRL